MAPLIFAIFPESGNAVKAGKQKTEGKDEGRK
jgi:hypothetical protein